MRWLYITAGVVVAVAVLFGVLSPAAEGGGGVVVPNKTVVLSCPLEGAGGGYVLSAPCAVENVSVAVFRAVSSDGFTGVVLNISIGGRPLTGHAAFIRSRGDWRMFVRPLREFAEYRGVAERLEKAGVNASVVWDVCTPGAAGDSNAIANKAVIRTVNAECITAVLLEKGENATLLVVHTFNIRRVDKEADTPIYKDVDAAVADHLNVVRPLHVAEVVKALRVAASDGDK
ncbi:MAG: hypothetical protein QXP31_07020 [Pyrobaculum sp.]